ncbi:MAG: glycosyltransferase family 4 protein [Turicibacter sp.]
MKVLYMTNLPVPYRIEFFEELGKVVNLTVTFEREKALNRDSAWLSTSFKNFKAIFLKGKKIGEEDGFCPEILNVIKTGNYDAVVIGVYHTPTAMMAIQYMKWRKIPYYISSDGGFIKADGFFKQLIKKNLISDAKGYFSPGNLTDRYLIHYGAKVDRIHRYPFTSLKKCDILHKCLTSEEKKMYKEKLGIKEEKIILGVGQFIHRKGWDILMRAMVGMPNSIGVYIVGGEPTEDYLKMKNELKLNQVHFIGFSSKEELKEYYKASDLFVLPTREDIWGLVINEAMAYGLPIITTDNCMAGLELVADKGTGNIIPVDDSVKLKESIQFFLEDFNNQKESSEKSLRVIKDYTIEIMKDSYAKVLMSEKIRRI